MFILAFNHEDAKNFTRKNPGLNPIILNRPEQLLGTINDVVAAGKVQLRFDLYDNAEINSSSSITIIFWSGNTLPTGLGNPLELG